VCASFLTTRRHTPPPLRPSAPPPLAARRCHVCVHQIVKYAGTQTWHRRQEELNDTEGLASYGIRPSASGRAEDNSLFVSTRREELEQELKALIGDRQTQLKLEHALGAASQEQALHMCELVHKKFNEMKEQVGGRGSACVGGWLRAWVRQWVGWWAPAHMHSHQTNLPRPPPIDRMRRALPPLGPRPRRWPSSSASVARSAASASS
jgi:hypothetical protein